jgi:hypothetical protein
VTNDLDSLAAVFGLLKFIDQELERSRVVRVLGVDEIQEVGRIPEI